MLYTILYLSQTKEYFDKKIIWKRNVDSNKGG